SAPGFIASIDTMKLSKDLAAYGFTSADAQAVDLAATTNATHITDNAPFESPAVEEAYANRIHADGKHVWFRLNVFGGNIPHGDLGDGYPTFAPGYLTRLHQVMLAHPGMFKAGDILDGDAEAENSVWWANQYGCGVQGPCTPCNAQATNKPCAPVAQFNHFRVAMTEQENRDLASLGIAGVDTTVHSTDPGTAQHQLYASTVQAMGDKITVDAYPDQNATEPAVAVANWTNALNEWHQTWAGKGINVGVLVGEWGYSNTINVSDPVQQAVIHAETQAFPSVAFLLGTNYWVGPGCSSCGGYTNIFVQEGGVWKLRPPAKQISAFYGAMRAALSAAPSGPPTPASGWHIVYGDAFGAPLGSGPGQDDTLQSGEKPGGCCGNSNEIAVEQHAQARVGPEGLELACSEGSFT